MEYKIDNDIWQIKLKDSEALLNKLNEGRDSDDLYTYAFGVCIYPKHEIWINKDSCKEQQIRTLKHELTHCFIFYAGLYNIPHFSEEMACDLVANSNNFINSVIDKFIEKQGDDKSG